MCDNILEITQQARLLRDSSVLFFDFSLTVLLTIFFLLFYRLVATNKSIIRMLFFASFFFYGLNVIRLVFFPLPFNPEYIALLQKQVECGVLTPRRHNLELFDYMKWDNLLHITTVGNFLLLMPLSFYLPLTFPQGKWNLIKITLLGYGISLLIELTQLSYCVFTHYIYRSFDVDDLMLNTLGVAMGYMTFILVKAIIVAFQKLRGLVIGID